MGRAELPVLLHSQATGAFCSADMSFSVYMALERLLYLTFHPTWRHLNKAAFSLLSQPCLGIPLPLVHREEEEVFHLCSFHFPPGGKGSWQQPRPCWEGTFHLLAGSEKVFDAPHGTTVLPMWFGLCL